VLYLGKFTGNIGGVTVTGNLPVIYRYDNYQQITVTAIML